MSFFGAPAAAAVTSSGGMFGNSAPATPAATTTSSGLFGNPTAPATTTTTTATAGLFGNAATPTTTATAGIFGNPTAPATTASAGLFGNAAATPTVAAATTTPSSGLFGSNVTPTASAPTTSNAGMFGNSATPTTATTTTPSASLFGNPTTSASTTTPTPAAAAPVTEAIPSLLFGSTSTVATPTTPATTTSSTTPLFGNPSTPVSSIPSVPATPGLNTAPAPAPAPTPPTAAKDKTRGVRFDPAAGGGRPGDFEQVSGNMPAWCDWVAMRSAVFTHASEAVGTSTLAKQVGSEVGSVAKFSMQELRDTLGNSNSNAGKIAPQLLLAFKPANAKTTAQFAKQTLVPATRDYDQLIVPPKRETVSASSVRVLINDASDLLDIDELSAAQLLQAHLSSGTDRQVARQAAAERIAALVSRSEEQTRAAPNAHKAAARARNIAARKSLKEAHTNAEVDAVERVLNRGRVAEGNTAAQVLMTETAKALAGTTEIAFGVHAGCDLLNELRHLHYQQRFCLLQVLLVMLRSALEAAQKHQNQASEAARKWESFSRRCADEFLDQGLITNILVQLSALRRASPITRSTGSSSGNDVAFDQAGLVCLDPTKTISVFEGLPAQQVRFFEAQHRSEWARQHATEMEMLTRLVGLSCEYHMLSRGEQPRVNIGGNSRQGQGVPVLQVVLRMLLKPDLSLVEAIEVGSNQQQHIDSIPSLVNPSFESFLSAGTAGRESHARTLEDEWLVVLVQLFELNKLLPKNQNSSDDNNDDDNDETGPPIQTLLVDEEMFDEVQHTMMGLHNGLADDAPTPIASGSASRAEMSAVLVMAWGTLLQLASSDKGSSNDRNGCSTVVSKLDSELGQKLFQTAFQQGLYRVGNLLGIEPTTTKQKASGVLSSPSRSHHDDDADALFQWDGGLLRDYDVLVRPWTTLGSSPGDFASFDSLTGDSSTNGKSNSAPTKRAKNATAVGGLHDPVTRTGNSSTSTNKGPRQASSLVSSRPSQRMVSGLLRMVLAAFPFVDDLSVESDLDFVSLIFSAAVRGDVATCRQVWGLAPSHNGSIDSGKERNLLNSPWTVDELLDVTSGLVNKEPLRQVLVALRRSFPASTQPLLRFCGALASDELSAQCMWRFLGGTGLDIVHPSHEHAHAPVNSDNKKTHGNSQQRYTRTRKTSTTVRGGQADDKVPIRSPPLSSSSSRFDTCTLPLGRSYLVTPSRVLPSSSSFISSSVAAAVPMVGRSPVMTAPRGGNSASQNLSDGMQTVELGRSVKRYSDSLLVPQGSVGISSPAPKTQRRSSELSFNGSGDNTMLDATALVTWKLDEAYSYSAWVVLVGQLVELSSAIAQKGVHGVYTHDLTGQLKRATAIMELINSFVSSVPIATYVLAQHLRDEELRRRARDESGRQRNTGPDFHAAPNLGGLASTILQLIRNLTSQVDMKQAREATSDSPASQITQTAHTLVHVCLVSLCLFAEQDAPTITAVVTHLQASRTDAARGSSHGRSVLLLSAERWVREYELSIGHYPVLLTTLRLSYTLLEHITARAVRPELHDVFARLDTSRTGKLSPKEFIIGLEALGYTANLSRDVQEELVRAFDTDGSGEVSYEEFLSFIQRGNANNHAQQTNAVTSGQSLAMVTQTDKNKKNATDRLWRMLQHVCLSRQARQGAVKQFIAHVCTFTKSSLEAHNGSGRKYMDRTQRWRVAIRSLRVLHVLMASPAVDFLIGSSKSALSSSASSNDAVASVTGGRDGFLTQLLLEILSNEPMQLALVSCMTLLVTPELRAVASKAGKVSLPVEFGSESSNGSIGTRAELALKETVVLESLRIVQRILRFGPTADSGSMQMYTSATSPPGTTSAGQTDLSWVNSLKVRLLTRMLPSELLSRESALQRVPTAVAVVAYLGYPGKSAPLWGSPLCDAIPVLAAGVLKSLALAMENERRMDQWRQWVAQNVQRRRLGGVGNSRSNGNTRDLQSDSGAGGVGYFDGEAGNRKRRHVDDQRDSRFSPYVPSNSDDWTSSSSNVGASSVNSASDKISMAALLGDHAMAMRKELVKTLRNKYASAESVRVTLELLLSIMCFQPAFAARLFVDCCASTQQEDEEEEEADDNNSMGDILDATLGLIKPSRGLFSKQPAVYSAAMAVLANLWGGHTPGDSSFFAGLVAHVRELPTFWLDICASLFVEVDNDNVHSWVTNLRDMDPRFVRDRSGLSDKVAGHCHQLSARSMVLGIMGTELLRRGPAQASFHEVLKNLQGEECDHKWLEQFQALHVFPKAADDLRSAAMAASVDLGPFDNPPPQLLLRVLNETSSVSGRKSNGSVGGRTQNYGDLSNVASASGREGSSLSNGGVTPWQTDRLFELATRDYGVSYMHNLAMLAAMDRTLSPLSLAQQQTRGKNGAGMSMQKYLQEQLETQLRFFNCTTSLADAQLDIMHSWKRYMETRCLMFWGNSDVQTAATGCVSDPAPIIALDSPTGKGTGFNSTKSSSPAAVTASSNQLSSLPPHMRVLAGTTGGGSTSVGSPGFVGLGQQKNTTNQSKRASLSPSYGGQDSGMSAEEEQASGTGDVSRHWGDVTSYTLVVDLCGRLENLLAEHGARLGGVEFRYQETYLCEMAEMLVSMLHFRVFQRTTSASGIAGVTGDGDVDDVDGSWMRRVCSGVGVDDDVTFTKRPFEIRSARLSLHGINGEGGEDSNPGLIGLLQRIARCCDYLLNALGMNGDDETYRNGSHRGSRQNQNERSGTRRKIMNSLQQQELQQNLTLSMLTCVLLLFDASGEIEKRQRDSYDSETGRDVTYLNADNMELQRLRCQVSKYVCRALDISAVVMEQHYAIDTEGGKNTKLGTGTNAHTRNGVGPSVSSGGATGMASLYSAEDSNPGVDSLGQIFDLSVSIMNLFVVQEERFIEMATKQVQTKEQQRQATRQHADNSVHSSDTASSSTKSAKVLMVRVPHKPIAQLLVERRSLVGIRRVFVSLSGISARIYAEEAQLLTWLGAHGLSNISVRLDSVTASSNSNATPQHMPNNQQDNYNKPGVSKNSEYYQPQSVGAWIKELGYDDMVSMNSFAQQQKQNHQRNDSEYCSLGRLLVDHGITQLAHLVFLDHAGLREMGMHRHSDRLRLLEAVATDDNKGLLRLSNTDTKATSFGVHTSASFAQKFPASRLAAASLLSKQSQHGENVMRQSKFGNDNTGTYADALASLAAGGGHGVDRYTSSNPASKRQRSEAHAPAHNKQPLMATFSRAAGRQRSRFMAGVHARLDMTLRLFLSTSQLAASSRMLRWPQGANDAANPHASSSGRVAAHNTGINGSNSSSRVNYSQFMRDQRDGSGLGVGSATGGGMLGDPSRGDRNLVTLGEHMQSLRMVLLLTQTPLVRAVAGESGHANVSAVPRGYTVQNTRCGAHHVWCLSVRLVSSLLRNLGNDASTTGGTNKSKTEREGSRVLVDQVLDFLVAHCSTLRASMGAFSSPWSDITMAQLQEVQVTTGLLMEMVPHTPHWRLRKTVFHPLIAGAWTLLHDLVSGKDVQRRKLMLEEFAETCSRVVGARQGADLVPKLSIRTCAVTQEEVRSSGVVAFTSCAPRPRSPIGRRGSSLGGSFGRYDSTVSEPSVDNEAGAGGGRAREGSTGEGGVTFGRTSQASSSREDEQRGRVSCLDVALESRIVNVLQTLFSLFRSRHLVKPRWMLENDDVTGMALPIQHWQKAEVAFSTHSSISATTPSASTLVSVLQYVKHRLFLAHVQRANECDGLVLSSIDIRNGCGVAWCDKLCFLLESALHVLVTSLELEQHDRLRNVHLGTGSPVATSATSAEVPVMAPGPFKRGGGRGASAVVEHPAVVELLRQQPGLREVQKKLLGSSEFFLSCGMYLELLSDVHARRFAVISESMEARLRRALQS